MVDKLWFDFEESMLLWYCDAANVSAEQVLVVA